MVNDIYAAFTKQVSDRRAMWLSRCSVLLVTLIAIAIAWFPDSTVMGFVSYAWAGFGATFGPLMLTSLFWKRSNKYGAIAGLLAGGLTIFIWKFFVRPLGGAWDIYELLPAFIVALLFIIVVSLATKAPEKEITDEFEKVKAMK